MPRRVLLDLRPLRESRSCRELFVGQTASMLGSQLTGVALAFEIYERTGSSFQVGALSLAQLLPFVGGSLAGGILGDAHDRRHLLVATSLLAAAASTGLAINSLRPNSASIVAIYLLSALAAGFAGVTATMVTAAVPSLVGSKELTTAYATLQVTDQLGMAIGPMLGGVLIAGAGLSWLFGIDSLTFVWAAVCFSRMGELRRVGTGTRRPPHALIDGLRYVHHRPDLIGAYLIDLGATVFGLPRALFPALVHRTFHRGPAVLGFFYAAPAIGALVGSLASGWVGRVRRPGRAVVLAVIAWGATIIAVGSIHELWIALLLLVAAGWFDLVSAIFRSAIVQNGIAEEFRGRVSSLQMAVVEGGPRLGDLESGAVAASFTPQLSVVSGGIACVVVAIVVAIAVPGFSHLVTENDSP